MKYILIKYLLIGLSIVASFFGSVTVVSYAPLLEEALFPVLSNQIMTVTRVGNVVRFEVIITKNRACKIETIGFHTLDRSGGIEYRVPVIVRSVTGIVVDENRAVYPVGTIRNGPFEAVLPEFMAGADEIIGQIEYRCHPLWLTPATYGPFKIPPLQ